MSIGVYLIARRMQLVKVSEQSLSMLSSPLGSHSPWIVSEEFQQLAESSGLNIVETVLAIKRSFTKAQFFIGTGKVDELELQV